MIYLVIISLLIVITYIIASIIKNKGIPVSLSDTYYYWNKLIFPAIMWITSFTLLPCWLEITKDTNWQFLAFISCAGLMFIGFSPNFKNDRDEFKIHMISAYIIALTSIISILLISGFWWILLIILLILEVIIFWNKLKTNWVFLIELAIFITVYISIISLI